MDTADLAKTWFQFRKTGATVSTMGKLPSLLLLKCKRRRNNYSSRFEKLSVGLA